MNPQELNQEEQKNISGGFLLGDILGNNQNQDDSSSSSGEEGNNSNSSSGLFGDLPLLGDIL